MTVDAWLTLAVIAGVLGLLVRTSLSPALVIFGATVSLLVLGVIDTEQALSGFSNPAPFTVAALYVVAAAVQKTGALTPIMQRTLGERGWYRLPLLRVLPPTAVSSAFLNNTPIVAMLIPQISSWADRRQVSVSKLLMPLSFAALLGGMATLIGTSTNLVVAGQMADAGLEPMGFFEISAVGVPVAVVGIGAIIALAPRVLPGRRSPMAELQEAARRFSIEMVVQSGGPVDGKTVEQARLRHLTGVFLTSVDRGDTIIAPVRPETVLRGGNRLRFAGQVGTIVDLQTMRGLEPAEMEHVLDLDHPQVSYYEVVIGSQFPGHGPDARRVRLSGALPGCRAGHPPGRVAGGGQARRRPAARRRHAAGRGRPRVRRPLARQGRLLARRPHGRGSAAGNLAGLGSVGGAWRAWSGWRRPASPTS